jgi:hypothetical protein
LLGTVGPMTVRTGGAGAGRGSIAAWACSCRSVSAQGQSMANAEAAAARAVSTRAARTESCRWGARPRPRRREHTATDAVPAVDAQRAAALLPPARRCNSCEGSLLSLGLCSADSDVVLCSSPEHRARGWVPARGVARDEDVERVGDRAAVGLRH